MYWFQCNYDNFAGLLNIDSLTKVTVDEDNKTFTLHFDLANVTLSFDISNLSTSKATLDIAFCFIHQLKAKIVSQMNLGLPFLLDNSSVQTLLSNCI